MHASPAGWAKKITLMGRVWNTSFCSKNYTIVWEHIWNSFGIDSVPPVNAVRVAALAAPFISSLKSIRRQECQASCGKLMFLITQSFKRRCVKGMQISAREMNSARDLKDTFHKERSYVGIP